MSGLLRPPPVAMQGAYDVASLGLAIAATVLALAGLGLLLVRSERRRDAELRTLAGLALAASSTPDDAAELAELAYIHAARLLPTDFFQLGLFQGETYRTLIWVRDGDRVHNREFELDPEQAGLVGWIRQTGEPLLVEDFQGQADRLPAKPGYASDDPPRSGIFVPITVETVVVGVLAVQSRRRRAFRQRELLLLKALSGAVSTSLAGLGWRGQARSRDRQIALLEEISRLLTPLEPLESVLPDAAAAMSRQLDASTAAIIGADDAGFHLKAIAGSHTPERLLSEPDVDRIVREAAQGLELVRHASEAGTPGQLLWHCATPLRVQDRVLGVLYVSRRSEPFHRADRRLMDLIASQLALAFLEAANFSQQQEEAWFTTVLLEVARHAAEPGDPQAALQAVMELTTLLAGTRWAVLLTLDAASGRLVLTAGAGIPREGTEVFSGGEFRPGAFGVEQPPYDEAPRPCLLPTPLADMLGSNRAMASELNDGNALLGILLVQGDSLEDRRLSLLAGIAHQVSLRLENTRLAQQAAVQLSLERELETARSIQESFLPEAPPRVPGWDLGAYWRAARSVGGDFYDFIPLAEGTQGARWGLVVADVTDKGVPAALYMALARTLLRSIATYEISPSTTLSKLNRLLLHDTRADMFVTMVYAIWEPAAARLTYATAGHPPPLLFLPGQGASMLTAHQALLGAMPDVAYEDTQVFLPPGSLLVLYTDGVSEAPGPRGDLFGPDRVAKAIEDLPDWSPAVAIPVLAEAVSSFGSGEPADDQTIVCVYHETSAGG